MNQQTVPNPESITLECIIAKKEALRLKINEQKQKMHLLTREIVAPAVPMANKSNSIMRAFNTGMAAFDGIMMGMKIMRRIRKLFR